MIDPAQLPHLPVKFMDEDHVQEVQLLNAALELLTDFKAGKADAGRVNAALDSLYVHTRAHFAREEAAMLDASFPAYSFHQAEHVRILGELGEAERKFRETGRADELATYLATLPSWLIQHIQTMDSVTARYIAEWGG